MDILKAEFARFLVSAGIRGYGEKAGEWGEEREMDQP